MVKKRKRILLLTLLVFIISLVFIIPKVREQYLSYLGDVKTGQMAKKQVYHCPMHPNYTSDKPGECPICGMTLVLKKEEEKPAEKGEVFISPEKQQLIGVKTETVKYINFIKEITAKGIVSYDEKKIYEITTKVDGYIEKLWVNYTGKFVNKGEPLFTIYSPELVSSEQEYLLALKNKEITEKSSSPEIKRSANELVESAKKKLKWWDMTDEQIKILEKTGIVQKTLTVYSPYSGFVTEKMVTEGMKIMPGEKLYEIVDISSVWVIADVYEQDIPLVKLGQIADISLLSLPGKRLKGKINYIYPYLDQEIRTVKIRIDVPNEDFMLKPGMYTNVEIDVNLGRRLAVEDTAVIDTGERQMVVLVKGNGYFKPIEVKLGQKIKGAYEVLSGLLTGDVVVANANFLVDSESKMKEALSGMTHEH